MFFKKNHQETIVFSVGGSLIIPNGGIDITFLKKFNEFIRKHVKKGRRFLIVVGGGTTARHYISAGKGVVGEISDEDLDWLGIHATRLNAHLFRTIFKDIAHPRIIKHYDRKLAHWVEPIAIGSGWKPGWSTDYDAVVLARDYKASVIINLSNIDWIYDKDPKKYSEAKPIKKTTWSQYSEIVGDQWIPGTNAPFDPVASQLAKKLGLTVIITNGNHFENLANILNGDNFKGTVITPFRTDASFYDREYFEWKQNKYRMVPAASTIDKLSASINTYYRALWIKLMFNPKNCLDIGCGTGSLVAALKRLGIEAHGIEISRYLLDRADNSLKSHLKFGDIVDIPYEDSRFDLVVSYDVLQHVERSKLKKAVEESVRVSRKYVLHKVYTTENRWINLFHKKDYSHLAVLPKNYWLNLFKYVEAVGVNRKFLFKLPGFFETIFLLKKK